MSRPESDPTQPDHDDFETRHALTPIELPFDDGEASTNVDLKTQMIRFIITGAGSGVLDFGLTIFLQYVVGADFWIAKSFGFILGTTTAYLLNRRWTFEAEPRTLRFISVVALYGVTFFVNVGLYTVLSHAWPETLLYSFIAYVIAQGTATVINFVVQRLVIFKIR
ncbi:GtrA family protein [Gordonia sp. ABSL49_1]|uniref:GtrA family protein n=1 Tax=Gordonia sp. ABSL49_1 TaxID=2920941 RepID=UPI001F102CC9|nr:GtrA family protein [Gordonia sp. ABSL49_1]MCH5643402.1 GtrA family protein [Gordonia sp. ABSL49_1]